MKLKKFQAPNENIYHLTNPARILYTDLGITKLDLAKYYDKIQEWILPYIINRPLTLFRCPTGHKKNCFFQKHFDNTSKGNTLHPIPIKEKLKTEEYIYIKDIDGLITLVQLGVLEIHPWGSSIINIEKPDVIIFDLDPAPDVPWKRVVKAAFFIREHLEQINLKSFVKITGGKGLHIVIPIRRYYGWDEIKSFTRTITHYIVAQNPDEYIGTMNKAKRKGKIFIDYLRNQRGATAIAPYSTRAKEHATIAAPIAWDELSHVKADTFNINNLPKRLEELKKDPWEAFFSLKQSLQNLKVKS